MLFQAKQKILFIGDSITDCGRRDETYQPLGWGYVNFIVNLIDATLPELELTYFNRGIGGNTILDLKSRWNEDCINLAPDWVSILIGINDAHKYKRDNQTELDPENYYKEYKNLLQQVIDKTTAKIILWEPFFFITPNTGYPPVEEIIGKYIEKVNIIAEELSERIVGTIHTQELFTEASKKRWIDFWIPEGVHPSKAGHMLMAKAFLEFIGFELKVK